MDAEESEVPSRPNSQTNAVNEKQTEALDDVSKVRCDVCGVTLEV